MNETATCGGPYFKIRDWSANYLITMKILTQDQWNLLVQGLRLGIFEFNKYCTQRCIWDRWYMYQHIYSPNILYFTYNTVNHLHCKFNNSLIWTIFIIDTLFKKTWRSTKGRKYYGLKKKNLKICIIFPGEGLGTPPPPISCLGTIAYPYLIFCWHPRVLVTCLCIPCTNWLLEVKTACFHRFQTSKHCS